jgi:hypothetical protein
VPGSEDAGKRTGTLNNVYVIWRVR